MNQQLLSFLISAALGGFIGWLTNWLAIKALFHPRKATSLAVLEFQGLLPKRQKELAQNLGKVIEGELLNFEELIKKVNPEDIDPIIEEQMHGNRIEMEEKAKSSIASFVSKIPLVKVNPDSIVRPIMDKLEKELVKTVKKQVPGVLDKAAKKATEKFSVKDLVQEKVSTMDLDKLESIVNRIADREMKMIIRLGGVLGVFIGSLHWLLQHYLI